MRRSTIALRSAVRWTARWPRAGTYSPRRFSARATRSRPIPAARAGERACSCVDEPRTLVGLGGFKGPPRDGVLEIGYAVAPDWEGRGIATAATRELLREAFTVVRPPSRDRAHAARARGVGPCAREDRLRPGRRGPRRRPWDDLALSAGSLTPSGARLPRKTAAMKGRSQGHTPRGPSFGRI